MSALLPPVVTSVDSNTCNANYLNVTLCVNLTKLFHLPLTSEKIKPSSLVLATFASMHRSQLSTHALGHDEAFISGSLHLELIVSILLV
jgi:hypothetical protein